MTVTSYPGVYVEEIPGGARPINAAGTSTPAFFGVADRGPIGQVRKIFGFSEFEKHYGTFRDDGQFLAHAVFAFFNNGGRSCYVGRVARDHATASVTLLDRTVNDSAKAACLTIAAVTPGAWGNGLQAVVTSSATTPNTFDLAVAQEVIDPATGARGVEVREEFLRLSMDPRDARHVSAIVNSASAFVQVTVLDNSANAIAGTSVGGIVIGDDDVADFIAAAQRDFRINLHDDGLRTVSIAALDQPGRQSLTAIRAALQTAIRALSPVRQTTDPAVYTGATVTIETLDPTDPADPQRRRLRVTAGLAHRNSSVEIRPASDIDRSLTGALRLGVANGGTEAAGHSSMRPMDSAPTDSYLLGDDTVDASAPGRVAAVVEGSDGSLPQPADYDAAFRWLDRISDVSLLAVPGVGSTFLADSGMTYCRNRPLSDCFYVADMPADFDTLDEAKAFAADINTPNSYGAAYFPWLRMPDPTGRSPEPIVVPPSGFVTGLYAQTDTRRGVWKAPAGLDVQIGGVLGATVMLTDVEQGDLNKQPKSICVIRKFPSSGLVLWGARTLSTDPEYIYIPVRRTAIMLRKSIYDGIQWAVFEGNDERLWSALRLNIGSFMNGLFRSGAFQGDKASDAYFVRCGLGDTMEQGDIDRGEVIVQVGFAPLKPAEFVIVRIQQKVGQTV